MGSKRSKKDGVAPWEGPDEFASVRRKDENAITAWQHHVLVFVHGDFDEIGVYAWRIFIGQQEAAQGSGKVEWRDTINQHTAVWFAFGFALKWLLEYHSKDHEKELGDILILGDAKVPLYQLDEQYRCHQPYLKRLRDRCLKLLNEIGYNYSVELIAADNNLATGLCRETFHKLTGREYIPIWARRGYHGHSGEEDVPDGWRSAGKRITTEG